jgi:zinc transporter, ZIP family
MPPELQQPLTLIPFAVLAGIAGGVLGLFWTPRDTWRSYIQHLTAGMLTGIIAVDLLPEALEHGRTMPLVAGFAGGSLLMVIVKYVTDRLEAWSTDNLPLGLALSAAIDTAVDGAIIGVAFAFSGELGLLLTIGLGIELLVLTLSVTTQFKDAGAATWMTATAAILIPLMLALGMIVGVLTLGGLSLASLSVVLAFAAAALLYLVTEELLQKGHQIGTSPATVAAFFAGFLVLMAFTLLTSGG